MNQKFKENKANPLELSKLISEISACEVSIQNIQDEINYNQKIIDLYYEPYFKKLKFLERVKTLSIISIILILPKIAPKEYENLEDFIRTYLIFFFIFTLFIILNNKQRKIEKAISENKLYSSKSKINLKIKELEELKKYYLKLKNIIEKEKTLKEKIGYFDSIEENNDNNLIQLTEQYKDMISKYNQKAEDEENRKLKMLMEM